jgi:hypothetical protein
MTLEAKTPGSSQSEAKKNSKGILCAKCGHVSPAGVTRCERCEAHLHIKCNDCGATNARSQTRCKDCGRRLHKTALEKVNKRLFQNTAAIKPWHLALVIVAAGLIFTAIMFMLNLRLPSLY